MELSELIRAYYQKQSPRGVPRKRCSENMLQIYRTTPMPKCDFNKVALGGVGGGGGAECLYYAKEFNAVLNSSLHYKLF